MGVDLLLGVGVGALASWDPLHLDYLSRPVEGGTAFYTGEEEEEEVMMIIVIMFFLLSLSIYLFFSL